MTASRRRFQVSRDTIIFLFGIAGIVYETIVSNGDRPTLLILFGAMIGLPAFLHGDEIIKQRKPPDPPDSPQVHGGEK